MTATIRKQMQRYRLSQGGGKRLDLYLSADELAALEAYRIAHGLTYPADAVKSLLKKSAG